MTHDLQPRYHVANDDAAYSAPVEFTYTQNQFILMTEQIAEVVYEAATDGKDQLRYVAGADAKAMYAMRLQLGEESFRKAMAQQFFGEQRVAA